MDELKQMIEHWLVYDNKINEINLKIKKTQENTKELRNKRDILSSKITNYLIENKMEDRPIVIDNNQLKVQETMIQSSLTFKFLKDCLLQYFENEEETEKLLNFIKSNRTITKKIDLQRKHPKEIE